MKKSAFKEKIEKMKALIITLCFYLIFLGFGCSGCGSVKKVKPEDISAKTETSNPIPEYKDRERMPHPDSLAKWNAQYEKDLAENTLKPDSNTIHFTIDPKTGKVEGCPYIEFKGIYDQREDSIRYAKEQQKFDKLKPKLEKAWLGTKEITISEEFPEGEDRYPSSGFFSKNDEYIIVPDGYAHGGTVNKVYFFNKKGELIKVFKLGYDLQVPNYEMNAEKTFFILSSSVSPQFYIFYPDGRVFKQGDFHEVTKDYGTSYSLPIISENGKYLILRNNINWIYSEDKLVLKSTDPILDINEDTNTILSYKSKNIYLDEYGLYISSILNRNITYISNENVLKSKNFLINFK